MFTARLAFTFVASLWIMMLTSCQSTGPTIEGGGALGRVRVGEAFDVVQPYDLRTGAEWQLISYDSLMVYPKDFPRVETAPDGTRTRKIRFIAKNPGKTDLIFGRRKFEPLKPGQKPPKSDTATVTIHVVN